MDEPKNEVFDLLGAEGDDIEALTAYALYKRHKRKWAADFEDCSGKKPTPQDDHAFAKAVSTHDQLDRYRKDAQDILISFANQTVVEARSDIEAEAITVRIEQAANEISGQSSFKNQILLSLVSTGITTLFLIVVVIGLRLFGLDVLTGLETFDALGPGSTIAIE
jgi:hypothetical protein